MTAIPKIRVLIVDDSRFVRQAVARMLNASPDIEVVGQAADGREGIEKAIELKPDVVTLDVQMPNLGGLETLERLMEVAPVAVLLLCSSPRKGPTSPCGGSSSERSISSTSRPRRAR